MPPDGYDKNKGNPAGKVEDVKYQSSVTNSQRTMRVYTPPGYSTSQKYSVIYAIHGIGAWPDTIFADWCVGAAWVSDNLLAEKKIQPVIIVAMDNNNVDSHKELFDVIIPYVEKNYPVIADADHRGIYGYSLGGGVTFAEGIGHMDTFHHVSPSSAAPFNHPSDQDMFPNGGAEAKQKLKTLFISCGTADWDGFYPPNEGTHKYCEANGIPHAWLAVQGGGHDGGVWRPAMWNFLQLAFPASGPVIGTGGASGATGGSSGAGGAGGMRADAGPDANIVGSGGNGGSPGSGGAAVPGSGGSGDGGRMSTGGVLGSGGAAASGGSAATGGAKAGTGGATGAAAGSGGVVGTGGSSIGHGGSSASGKGGSTTTAGASSSGCSCAIGAPTEGSSKIPFVLMAAGTLLLCRRKRTATAPRIQGSCRRLPSV